MKLFFISQNVNAGYDTYDSAVVCAPNEEAARRISPSSGKVEPEDEWCKHTWAPYQAVVAEYLGEARDGMPVGVVVSSFNAG